MRSEREIISVLINCVIPLVITIIFIKVKGITSQSSADTMTYPFNFEISAPQRIIDADNLNENINIAPLPADNTKKIYEVPEVNIKRAIEKLFEESTIELQQYSLYKTLTKISKDRSSLCYKELQQIRNEYIARKPWAMKVIDATGVKPPGFLLGHNLWLGSRDTCNAAKEVTNLMISDQIKRNMKFGILNETAPIDISFKIAYFDFQTPWQVDWKLMPPEKTIIWGMCLPKSCSNMETSILLKAFLKRDGFIERKVLNIDAKVAEVRDLEFDMDIFDLISVRLLIGIFGFTIFMIIAAMFLRLCSNNSVKEDSDDNKNDKKSRENALLAILRCYDVKQNLTKIFHINESENGEINEICAIRSINAIFIVIAHVPFFSMFACINRTTLFSHLNRPLIGLVFIIVESFFILSGFLLTYNLLRNQKQRQRIKDASSSKTLQLFIKKLFHRWLRLAPPYYVIMCINTVLHALVNRISVYKLPFRDDLHIGDSWWQYLLFIQNFLKVEKFPALWVWSMACEMQFFIIGTTFLFIYIKHPITGKLLFLAVFSGSIISYFVNGINSNFMWTYDIVFRSAPEMYMNSFVRIISYLIGVFGAMYVVEAPRSIYSIGESAIANLSLIVFGIILSPLCDDIMTTLIMSSLALLLLRFTISLWICWLVIAAVNKRRTWLSAILELKSFQPISRLSYGIYLLNPIIITTIASLTNAGVLFDLTTLIIWAAGAIFLTKWMAVIFCVAFEMPYCNISSLLLKPKMVKKIS